MRLPLNVVASKSTSVETVVFLCFLVLDVICDCGDVAHVEMTTTLPLLDCLWLEKVLHTHAENNFNTSKRPRWSQIPAKETQLFTRSSGHTVREGPSSTKQPKCSLKQILRDSRKKPSSAHRSLSLNRQARSETKTKHASSQLRIALGMAYPMLYGNLGLPLPHLPVFQEEGNCVARSMRPNDEQPAITPHCVHSSCSTKRRSHCPSARSPPRPSCANQPKHMLSLLQRWVQTEPSP